MDKETYLRFLRALLMNRVPAEDAEDITRFYTEYFEEAGPEKESQIMAELGSPEELVARIMEQRAREEAEGIREPSQPQPHGQQYYTEPNGSGFPRWLGVVGVCICATGLVPVLGGMLLGFGAAGIGLIVCGALMFAVLGVGSLFGELGSLLLGIGGGLVMISIGSLLIQVAEGMLWLLKNALVRLWNILVEGEAKFYEAVN